MRGNPWNSVPVKVLTTANPAAGADPAAFTATPAGKVWELQGAVCVITTDGTGANRYPYLEINIAGVGNYLYAFQATPVTATIAGQICSFLTGVTAGGAIGASLIYVSPVTSIRLVAGTVVRFRFLNLQGGDDATAAGLYYKEV